MCEYWILKNSFSDILRHLSNNSFVAKNVWHTLKFRISFCRNKGIQLWTKNEWYVYRVISKWRIESQSDFNLMIWGLYRFEYLSHIQSNLDFTLNSLMNNFLLSKMYQFYVEKHFELYEASENIRKFGHFYTWKQAKNCKNFRKRINFLYLRKKWHR